MFWRRLKAWFRGESLKVEHLISELTNIVKRLEQHAEKKHQEADTEARNIDLARQRMQDAAGEADRAGKIAKRVLDIYNAG